MILKSHFLNYLFECVTDCSNLNTAIIGFAKFICTFQKYHMDCFSTVITYRVYTVFV